MKKHSQIEMMLTTVQHKIAGLLQESIDCTYFKRVEWAEFAKKLPEVHHFWPNEESNGGL